MSERAAPYYCPYCGDEDLVPHEGDAHKGAGSAWACGGCARVFRVKFVGLQGIAARPAGGIQTGGNA
ncbi:hypothetical protein ACQEU5_17930 [Marinactinospora thermotolerans]|uniref:Insertion element protein n=1 Tax=Marinactinospora thermotolerans DSM 45154 TaxID=1122192 RepID=A0A1T4S7G9_9ACTN|nr:hypothetical protein [Marinactinospora thermotolerans]SKA24209.1 hypothetical protein SAMN02745673_03290 [Marinactinospora thermotolerans DSM 45154]